ICLNLDDAGSVVGVARSGLGATRRRVLVKTGLSLSLARRAVVLAQRVVAFW
ncbi:hypothetical protein A2U01_0073097, partial [Trifolium medium]|nr:hypothetical protein [Trifolium medium]